MTALCPQTPVVLGDVDVDDLHCPAFFSSLLPTRALASAASSRDATLYLSPKNHTCPDCTTFGIFTRPMKRPPRLGLTLANNVLGTLRSQRRCENTDPELLLFSPRQRQRRKRARPRGVANLTGERSAAGTLIRTRKRHMNTLGLSFGRWTPKRTLEASRAGRRSEAPRIASPRASFASAPGLLHPSFPGPSSNPARGGGSRCGLRSPRSYTLCSIRNLVRSPDVEPVATPSTAICTASVSGSEWGTPTSPSGSPELCARVASLFNRTRAGLPV